MNCPERAKKLRLEKSALYRYMDTKGTVLHDDATRLYKEYIEIKKANDAQYGEDRLDKPHNTTSPYTS